MFLQTQYDGRLLHPVQSEYSKCFILKHGCIFKTDDATDIKNYAYHTFTIVMIFTISWPPPLMCDVVCHETNTCNNILL